MEYQKSKYSEDTDIDDCGSCGHVLPLFGPLKNKNDMSCIY